MIKTLQKKFIYSAMAAVTVLLLVLISGINITNSWINIRQTDRHLAMLSDTETHILKQEKPEFPADRFFDKPSDKPERKNLFNPPIDKDTAMSLRFFVVHLGADNSILNTNVSRISSVTEDEASEYAHKALEKQKKTGYISNFKFKITDQDKTDGVFKIIVFLDASRQSDQISAVLALSAAAALVCWFFMLLPVILLSRKAIRPIARNIQRQKQFVTDAGHEIKTPLAVIQANIDAMELINGENKWSRNIRSQTVRLNGLMQNLLTLAKMDEENQNLQMTVFSFSELCDTALQPFYEPAALRQITIQARIQPDLFIQANQEYMQRLLSVLFDNAVKYADSKGTVTVTLQTSAGKILLHVENTCSRLPQDDAEKLFDRFYRADSARTQKNGGYGIGLSAAYAIVKAHKGTISAKYAGGNTVIFTVELYAKEVSS